MVKECNRGNSIARRKLYDMYAPQMLSLCHRYAGNADDAKDIFQHGFYLVFKNLKQLRDHSALSGWVKRIFVNASLQYYERNRSLFVVDDMNKHESVAVDLVDPLSRLSETEIIELIQKLPSGARQVFNMYVVEGYSHKEIAKELGISEGTSKSQLYDARRALQKAVLKNEHFFNRKSI